MGTFVGSIIVNGILGLPIPYTDTELKTNLLPQEVSKIITPSDTIEFKSYIQYAYRMKSDSSVEYNHVDLAIWKKFFKSDQDLLTLQFLPEGDIIPYVSIRRECRLVDNKWVTEFGLPRGHKTYIAFIPNDSIHNMLIEHLNDKFFTNEKEKLAQSN